MAEIEAMAVATTSPRASRTAGPDRLTVVMFTLAGFLAVLSLLASGLRAAPRVRTGPPLLVRRVYETRIVEARVGAATGGSTVTQSLSSSGSAPAPVAAATTRSS